MKRTLLALGSAGLATVLLASGLTTGSSTAWAADDPRPEATSTATPVVFNDFLPYAAYAVDRSLRSPGFQATYAEAVATADTTWSFPAVGQTGQIRSADGSCLYANTSSDVRVRYAPCAAVPAASESRWTVTADGRVESASYVMTNWSSGSYLFLGRSAKSSAGLRLVGPHTGLGLEGVTVASSSFDATGALTLTGGGTPGSEIGVGAQKAVVEGSGRTGTWRLRIADAPGTVEVQQWVTTPSVGWQRYDATTVDVGMTARIESVDQLARTAVVTGTARPGATVLVQGDRLDIGAAGTFSYTATGLSLGSNPVRFDESVGGTVRSTATVDAHIDVRALTAEARFEKDAKTPVTLSGDGEPGARIEVLNESNAVVATTTAGATGWSTALPAPGAPGVYPVRVHQLVAEELGGEVALEIDYGAGIAVTSPIDGTIVDSAPLHLRGTGQPGRLVTVAEAGTTGYLGSTTVAANGVWALTTSTLEKREYVLVASQLGRGANTTAHTLTVNPGQHLTPAVDAVITSPEGYVAGRVNRVSGTATPNATLLVTNPWGTVIARDVKVDALGAWSFDRAFSGASTLQLHFTQTLLDGRVHTNGPIAFGPAPSVFRVVSPEPAAGFVPDSAVTFTGMGEPGSTISMTNKWGTVLAQPVTTGADGRWSITRVMTGTSTYQVHFVQNDRGTVTTATFYNFAPRR